MKKEKDFEDSGQKASKIGGTAYAFPERELELLAEPEIVVPICNKIIDELNKSGDYKTRMQAVEIILEDFVDALPEEKLLTAVVDFLVWIGTLESFLAERCIEKSVASWMVKYVLHCLDEYAGTGDKQARLFEKIGDKMDSRTRCFRHLFEVVFVAEAFHDFFEYLCSPFVFDRFVNFLFAKLGVDTHRVFLWILRLKLYNFIENLPVHELVYHALTANETGLLLEICSSDETKEMPAKVVTYLDNVAGSLYKHYDPEYFELEPTPMNDEMKRREKEFVNLAFGYRKRFNFDIRLVENCIFVRQFKAFINAFFEYEKNKEKQSDAFYQKAYHIISEGGKRVQSAALSYLTHNRSTKEAIVLALKMDVPRSEWPSVAGAPRGYIEEAKRLIADREKEITKELMSIKDGFNLLYTGVHIVRLVDSEAAEKKYLKSFINDQENEYFGLDVKWDMTYSGDIGSVCLIQMSSLKETLLIDVHSLRNVHKWSDEDINEIILANIFLHGKNVYGFALTDDIKTLAYSFPTFNTGVLPQLTNLVCLYESVKNVCTDVVLSNAIFDGYPPTELTLAHLSKHIIGVTLAKEEQSGVWRWRPLRKAQQISAAKDSFATVHIAKHFIKRVEENCPDKMDAALVPWTYGKKKKIGDLSASAAKKTKSSQTTLDELKSIIKTVNSKLGLEKFTNTKKLFFIADTMCSPLGSCLRRVGVSANSGKDASDVTQQAHNKASSKILTTGKACKKYPFGDRVINVRVSLPLDVQFFDLLLREKICIDPDKIVPRCSRCNANEMIFVPELVVRYIHLKTVAQAGGELEIGDFLKLEDDITHMDSRKSFTNYCFGQKSESGLVVTCPRALINLSQFLIYHLENNAVKDAETPIKLRPAMNLLGSSYNQNQMYAICFNCGKENSEYAIDP